MKKIVIFFCLIVLFTLIAIMAIHYHKAQKTLVLKGGTLIDGTGNMPLENSLIIIENGTIKSVSQIKKIRPPLFARVINTREKFIIPGLIDMHVHFNDEHFSKLFLLNGVTAVRDVGNKIDFILSLRDKINSGILQGPTTFVSGYLINNRQIPFAAGMYTGVVKKPEEARKVVSLLAKKKVDWIKIYISLPPRLVRIVIQEAKKRKIPVAGHLRRVNARLAAQWGIRTLEHATGIAEALLADEDFEDAPPNQTISHKTWLHVDKSKYGDLIGLLINKGVYITANLTLYQSFVSTGEELQKNPHVKLMPTNFQKSWPDYISNQFLELTEDKESWKITKTRLEEFLLMFKNKGGKILAGSDTPWPYLVPGFSLHKELELLVEAGLSPMEALLTATKYPAEALNQENNLGTIEAGKTANLVLLNANPLQDIRHTQNIDLIIKGGKIIKREKLYRSLLNQIEKEQ